MPKLHRMLLPAILLVAASIIWALPLRAHQVQADTETLILLSNAPIARAACTGSGNRLPRGAYSVHELRSSQMLAGHCYDVRVGKRGTSSAYDIAQELVLYYPLYGGSILLSRRMSAHHPAKNLLGTAAVSAGNHLHPHIVERCHCPVSAGNTVTAAAFGVPLVRGPTHSAC